MSRLFRWPLNGLCLPALLASTILSLPTIPAHGGPPPPPPQQMPGEVRATVRSRWLAPGVSVTERRTADGPGTSVVSWLAPDGKVRRELAATSPPGQGIVFGDGRSVYAVSGDWQVAVPDKGLEPGYVTASPDSRTLVHEFLPGAGLAGIDVYVEGALVNTLGPYRRHLPGEVTVGGDGALALLAWKDEKKAVALVVVAGPDGKERFRAECDGPVAGAEPAPEGAAALVQSNGGAGDGNVFSLYDRSGKVSSMNVGPNARLASWVGATPTAVMGTSIGDELTWHVIDWRAGKRLQVIHEPNPARVTWAAHPVATLKDYLLVGGLEYLSYEGQKLPARSVYAVRVADGRVAAHWLPVSKHQPTTDAGWFLRLRPRLYFITDEAYCEITPSEIAGHSNGWK